MSSSQVLSGLAVMTMFGTLGLLSLGVIKDFRGWLSSFEERYPAGSADRKRARLSSLFPAWFGLIGSTAAVLGVAESLIAHAL